MASSADLRYSARIAEVEVWMSDDDEPGSGVTRGLRSLLSRGSKPGEAEGGEVIALAGRAAENEEDNPFRIDPGWREVEGDWVGGENAVSMDTEVCRAQTMAAISRHRLNATSDGDRRFLAMLYARLGERDLGLPGFPETPVRLEQLMSEEDPNSQQVMRCIESDPKLVGRVWSRARSARFPSAPGSLDMAVSRIGLVEVWRLSLESALDAFDCRGGTFKDEAEVIRVHGALVAEVTSTLMGQRRGPSFLAGLLHDVGRLLLLQVASQTNPEPSMVRDISNSHHASISVLVAAAWQLDAEVIPAVAFHHDPNACHAGPRDLSRLLCLADIAVDGELDRRAQRNSHFIEAMAKFTRSRVLASKAINQSAIAIDRMEADL